LRNVLLKPYFKEKTMRMLQTENKMEFIVRKDASKIEVRLEFEATFNVRVQKVNTRITKYGKHAIIKLHPDYSAEDVGSRIGVF